MTITISKKKNVIPVIDTNEKKIKTGQNSYHSLLKIYACQNML